MRLRVPRTLWLWMTLDLVRLVAVITAVLVVVLSFAATVKFFVEGKLSPADTLRFMTLAVPPMLHYALPFAAGFGATLSYHRLEEDHERVGAHAGGISHRALLAPAAAVGLALFGVLYGLNQEVSPRFLRRMEELVTERVGRAIENAIEQGEPIEVDRMMIHADRVQRLPVDEASAREGGPYERLALFGVGALELDDEGRVLKEMMARIAWVYLYRASGSGEGAGGEVRVEIRLEDAFGLDEDGTRLSGEALQPDPVVVPEQFHDDPKFLTRGELVKAYRDPDRLNVVQVVRENLAYHEASRQVTELMRAHMRDDGYFDLRDSVGRRLRVFGGGISWAGNGWKVAPVNGAVRVERSDGLLVEAAEATLRIDLGEDKHRRRLALSLSLPNASRAMRDEGAGTEPGGSAKPEWVATELRPVKDPLPGLLQLSSPELLGVVAPRRAAPNPDSYIESPARDLEEKIASLRREIVSKGHERVAMAMASLVMVLTGSITAMRLGRTLPLVVYLWSFFPALAAVLTVSTGQQLAHDLGLVGLVVLWGGIGGLGAYSLVAFRGLVRH